jgi:hypothetical protein
LMICSSVNLLLRIPSPEGTDSTQKRGHLRGAGQSVSSFDRLLPGLSRPDFLQSSV